MFVFPISYKCEDSLWIKEGDKVKKKENWHVKREGEGDGDSYFVNAKQGSFHKVTTDNVMIMIKPGGMVYYNAR